MPFEIIACGFNAHGQLLPNEGAPAYNNGIPDDIFTPTPIARAEVSARVLYAGWAETILELDGKVHCRGAGYGSSSSTIKGFGTSSPPYKAFGDGLGCKIILTNGSRAAYAPGNSHEWAECHGLQKGTEIIAIAGNGKVLTARDGTAYAYPSLADLPRSTGSILHLDDPVADITATETSFTLLTASGALHTLGDPRHDRLLGRDLTITPGTDPGLVDALDGIKIASIASGGWLCAALSAERDLYVWGGRVGGEEGELEDLEGVGADEVALVDLGGGVDVVGVSVGAGHVAAVTEDGRVWVGGRAGSGQAGSGQAGVRGVHVGFEKGWRELHVGAGRVVEVVCGGWATFVVVERREHE